MLKYATGIFLTQGQYLAYLLRCPTYSLPLKRLCHLSTAATHSPRFVCHRQRSVRSPGKISNANTTPNRRIGGSFYACNSPPDCYERHDNTWPSCCGTRHIPCRRRGFVICRPRPLIRLACPAAGSARLIPLGR